VPTVVAGKCLLARGDCTAKKAQNQKFLEITHRQKDDGPVGFAFSGQNKPKGLEKPSSTTGEHWHVA
jgi:hypothetical protein